MTKLSPKYYRIDGTLIVFNKYYLDEKNHLVNKKTDKQLIYTRDKEGYHRCGLQDDCGKRYKISIARMLISTFVGPPLTRQHTVDHEDKNRENDMIVNLRWLCKKGQNSNRIMPETFKSSFIIIKDGDEKTAKEWVEYLKEQKNSFGRDYTEGMIRAYAQKKHHGFAYKVYPDLRGEVWKEVVNSNTNKGHWEISDMCRVKYITKYAENVISDERFGLDNGYPTIIINKKHWKCHILAFMTFFPEEYATKKQNYEILHDDDDRLDFRPHKLRLGTRSENIIDAHNNGCYEGTKRERQKCASYINDILEKEYDSQETASKYLKSMGMTKANQGEISKALKAFRNGKIIKRYGRVWKLV